MLSVRFASEIGRTSLSENSQKLYCAQNLVNTKLVEEVQASTFLFGLWSKTSRLLIKFDLKLKFCLVQNVSVIVLCVADIQFNVLSKLELYFNFGQNKLCRLRQEIQL